VEGLQHGIEAIRSDWIDLVPEVDPEFEARFDSAWQAAKEHLARRRQEEMENAKRDAETSRIHTERVVPRLALIQRVESMAGDAAEGSLEEMRAEWDRLRFLDTPEGEALQARFDQACAELQHRLQARLAQQKAQHEQEQKESSRKEKERRDQENLRRLEQLCSRAEKILAGESLSLKAADRILREIRQELEEREGSAPGKEGGAFRSRLRKAQAALAPRMAELRQSESWKLWANEGIQEELCRDAESLAGLEDAADAGRRLLELQARWRQASTASRDKSQELWVRFKAARDRVEERLEESQKEQALRKEAICAKAEELSGSDQWIPTAEELKRLQKEWQALSSAGRARDRHLWIRFRGACDAFFSRRKEDLKQRKTDWAKNLTLRQALCEQAEAHADSIQWEASAGVLKKLQADWKTVGPVGRKDSEATWKRFRGACDRFFERYKRRHEIERDERIAQREKICGEIEGLLSPEAGMPATLAESLLALRKRWAENPPLPASQAGAQEERFQRAFDAVIQAFPEAMRDTELDAVGNRQKMEEIIAKVEKLMPQRNVVDTSGLSPAARLATMWVEAMAANTIGGSMAESTELRAAQEEVRRSQAVWEKIGYLPAPARAELAERFQRACTRILGPGGSEAVQVAEPPRRSNRPRRPR
jgi:hypothetical protein